MKEMQIRVNGDQIRFIYSDDLIDLMKQGEATTRRASHVEPDGDVWIADMSPVGGPQLGPFPKRSEALEAEVKWLNENKIPITVGENDNTKETG